LDQHAVFLLLGLANGAVFAALALALVVTFRSSASSISRPVRSRS